MALEVGKLDGADVAAYEEFIANCEDALFTHSWDYLTLLDKLIPTAKRNCIALKEDGRIRGLLPSMTKEYQGVKVVNSLPFFGSHGGVILRDNQDSSAAELLYAAWTRLSAEPNVLASTTIESPFNLIDSAKDYLTFTHSDYRIGQVTDFPVQVLEEYSRKGLLAIFDKRARNSISRSLRSSLKLEIQDSPKDLYQVYDLHVANMKVVGGTPKPETFPAAVIDTFEYGKDYKVFTASDNGKLVAGLLVFYFKDFVEYFMPATRVEYRVDQPMSGLILLAMEDAVVRGCRRRWNWGGTWLSQTGVYDFKRKFGAVDYPYRYFSQLRSDVEWNSTEANHLAEKFPYFYIAPFPN